MKTPYICDYLHNSGKICGKACIQPERCQHHWKTRKRYPCTDCGKPTATACGRYAEYIRGYYMMQYYNKLRDKVLKLDQVYTDMSKGKT